MRDREAKAEAPQAESQRLRRLWRRGAVREHTAVQEYGGAPWPLKNIQRLYIKQQHICSLQSPPLLSQLPLGSRCSCRRSRCRRAGDSNAAVGNASWEYSKVRRRMMMQLQIWKLKMTSGSSAKVRSCPRTSVVVGRHAMSVAVLVGRAVGRSAVLHARSAHIRT
jgi:hypothetical protein